MIWKAAGSSGPVKILSQKEGHAPAARKSGMVIRLRSGRTAFYEAPAEFGPNIPAAILPTGPARMSGSFLATASP